MVLLDRLVQLVLKDHKVPLVRPHLQARKVPKGQPVLHLQAHKALQVHLDPREV